MPVMAGSNVIHVPTEYQTIQQAIDHSNPGDTIYVHNGTYHENLLIDKSNLTLVGENIEATIIDGNGVGTIVELHREYPEILHNVTITGFTVTNGGADGSGILLNYANNCSICGNKIAANKGFGVRMYYSSNNVLRNNSMSDNSHSFSVFGFDLSDFMHDVDRSNTVNGKPIYYWLGKQDEIAPSDAGYFAAIDSKNITVQHLNLNNNGEGILFAFTSNSLIRNVTITNNDVGINLVYSHYNNISTNNLSANIHRSIGIWAFGSSRNTIQKNTVASGYYGIYLDFSSRNTVVENDITDNDEGISCYNAAENTISGNSLANNGYGILLDASKNNVLRNNALNANNYSFGIQGGFEDEFMNDVDTSNLINGKRIYYMINRQNLTIDALTYPSIGYLGIINSTNIIVRNVTIEKNRQAILLAYTNYSLIENCVLSKNSYGIELFGSSNNNISDCNLANGGISLVSSSDNSVSDNTMTNGSFLIFEGSSNNTISRNTIQNSDIAISLQNGHGNLLVQNYVAGNLVGLRINEGPCTLRGNQFVGNHVNLHIESTQVQDIDVSNTVDGKPVYYWIGEHNTEVPSDAGFVALVDCTNVTARNLTITNNNPGILVAGTIDSWITQNCLANCSYEGAIKVLDSSGIHIKSNNISDSGEGIRLQLSTNVQVEQNSIVNSMYENIDVFGSSNNTISRNLLMNGRTGIQLWGLAGPIGPSDNNVVSMNDVVSNERGLTLSGLCTNDTFFGNNLRDNNYGLRIFNCTGNSFYQNNFINNVRQVTNPFGRPNTWDQNYPFGGNYWGDYTSNDLYNGAHQNETGFDWIGDTAYVIDQKNTDRYPLMLPFVPEAEDVRIAYRGLLLRFSEVNSRLDASNSTVKELFGSLDYFNATVNDMKEEIKSLNSTCGLLQEQINNLTMAFNTTSDSLQRQIQSLNTTCVNLNQSVSNLQDKIDSLNSTLQTSINKSQEQYNSLSNQLNNVQNVLYIFMGITIILIATTVYLAIRKQKTKPET